MERNKYLSPEEVARLRTVTEADSVLALKNGHTQAPKRWMLVDLALQTGLRVSEMVALTVEDLDKRGGLWVIRVKKLTRTRELMPISRDLQAHLTEHLLQYSLIAGSIWPGQRGNCTKQGLQRLWRRAMLRAGLPPEISIHCARHTLAVHLLRKSKNLRLVQKQLGHSSPVTTAMMYADVAWEESQDALNGLYDNPFILKGNKNE